MLLLMFVVLLEACIVWGLDEVFDADVTGGC